uniref:Uncharacterized protein n=1 Tax=Chromera velia CCMP2878 TaxID=1169474 RepID=A0A0G4HGS2_9ALVE|eukprot:Cvel_6790.t1-p1 / transcript=Cvel_6790.t1 / gene=Cvel_6790 / organism=Chromera_velia_CCMP2878 / gene_product=hypothetical protein / transcript_product=hypothetical protein / location=Cvel_scaffold341:44833-45492(-) / protein_length=220 / sequence_SO=supercontig / SO=protein_coding / is_pseudo=false
MAPTTSKGTREDLQLTAAREEDPSPTNKNPTTTPASKWLSTMGDPKKEEGKGVDDSAAFDWWGLGPVNDKQKEEKREVEKEKDGKEGSKERTEGKRESEPSEEVAGHSQPAKDSSVEVKTQKAEVSESKKAAAVDMKPVAEKPLGDPRTGAQQLVAVQDKEPPSTGNTKKKPSPLDPMHQPLQLSWEDMQKKIERIRKLAGEVKDQKIREMLIRVIGKIH